MSGTHDPIEQRNAMRPADSDDLFFADNPQDAEYFMRQHDAMWVNGPPDWYRQARNGNCCEMHNRYCEPPGDLCCRWCSETRHGNPFDLGAHKAECVLERGSQ